MKPKTRTPQWLAAARSHAGLTQVELARLAGLKSTIIVSLIETGAQIPSHRTWSALEAALRPRVPLMFVDEGALVNDLEAGMRLTGDDTALCWLSYVSCGHGIAFIDAKLAQGKPPAVPYITVSLAEALALLKTQRTWFDDSSGEPQEGREDGYQADCEGARLREMRKALGLDQRDVARMLSASQPSISHLERGAVKNLDFARRYRELLEQLTEQTSN